jgi:hypothetical protein
MEKKVDVVIVSARYSAEDGRVSLVQAYQRLGPIWSDILLFDRDQLVGLMKARKRVVTGHPREMPGDFRITAQVRLRRGKLMVDKRAGDGEALGVPLF